MAFPGFLKLVGNVETKKLLTDIHAIIKRAPSRQQKTGAQANQET
jgi:hypothetical protein